MKIVVRITTIGSTQNQRDRTTINTTSANLICHPLIHGTELRRSLDHLPLYITRIGSVSLGTTRVDCAHLEL